MFKDYIYSVYKKLITTLSSYPASSTNISLHLDSSSENKYSGRGRKMYNWESLPFFDDFYSIIINCLETCEDFWGNFEEFPNQYLQVVVCVGDDITSMKFDYVENIDRKQYFQREITLFDLFDK